MKMLKKLALVSAVSMISAGAFAMEAMDDESMAAATGQDGITILIAPAAKTNAEVTALGVSATTRAAIDLTTNGVPGADGKFKGLSIAQINIHDDDGLANNATLGGNANTVNSGALVIGGNAAGLDRNGDAAVDALDAALDSTVVIADNATPIRIDLDMVGNVAGGAGNAPMLNVAITTPQLGIKLGDIYVANSDASEVNFNADGGVDTSTENDGTTVVGAVRIISGFEIVLGGATTVIQLGNEAQGAMIVANTTLVGGLTINNFALFDNNGATTAVNGAVTGSIAIGQLKVTNNGTNTADLKTNVRIDAVGTGAAAPLGEGLYINMVQVGDGTGIDVALNDVGIGSYTAATGISTAAVIGDVQLIGLDVSGTTMIIRGH